MGLIQPVPSVTALKWLVWQEHQRRLQHPKPDDLQLNRPKPRRSALVQLPGRRLDHTTHSVYEFQGCFMARVPSLFLSQPRQLYHLPHRPYPAGIL